MLRISFPLFALPLFLVFSLFGFLIFWLSTDLHSSVSFVESVDSGE